VKFLSRFQRLERPRPADEPARHTTAERFRAIEPLKTEDSIPEAHCGDLARFAPQVEPPLELQPKSDAQPFVRCPSCGVDSPVGARRCRCGTALDTLEAVAFNTALWDSHREGVARHEAEQARSRAEQIEEAGLRQEESRAMGEAIAREIAEREGATHTGSMSRAAGALLVLAVLAGVLLPRGPLARGVFGLLVGAFCVRAVVGWTRRTTSPD
jgi:hypothetical protein